jgi:hypothetical protein
MDIYTLGYKLLTGVYVGIRTGGMANQQVVTWLVLLTHQRFVEEQ